MATNEHKTRKRPYDGTIDDGRTSSKKAKTTGTKSKNSKKLSPDPQIPLEYSLNGAPHLWVQPLPSANPVENTIYEPNLCNSDTSSPVSCNSELSFESSPFTTCSDNSNDNILEMVYNSFANEEYIGSTDSDSLSLDIPSMFQYFDLPIFTE